MFFPFIHMGIFEDSPKCQRCFEVNIGQTSEINWNCYYDVSDDLVDIDNQDETKGLTVEYNIVSEDWVGDDNDGYTNGSHDGTESSDDDDGFLSYEISTV